MLPDIVESVWAFGLWAIGAFGLVIGVLGAIANLTTRNLMGSINPALMTAMAPPIGAGVASAYVAQCEPGARTIATRLMVFRDAALLVALGATFFVGAVAVGGW